jgi:hypothetical protein
MGENRWKMLQIALHAATCYLNPRFFGLERNNDIEVMSGLYTTIVQSTLNQEEASQESVRLGEQLQAYRLEEGIFGSTSSIHPLFV